MQNPGLIRCILRYSQVNGFFVERAEIRFSDRDRDRVR